MPGADRTAGVVWTPKTPSWAPRVQNWGLGGGLVPMDLGRVDGEGGVQSPETSTRQVSCRGKQLNGAGLGWAVGRGWADSRTQQGGKCLREKAVGCLHTCVDIRAVFLTASPLTPQGAGRQAHPDSHRAQEQPCWKLSSLLSCAHASSQSRSSRGRYRVGVHPVSISPVPTPCSQLSNPPPHPARASCGQSPVPGHVMCLLHHLTELGATPCQQVMKIETPCPQPRPWPSRMLGGPSPTRVLSGPRH